jgi:hypothetical protein
MKRSEMVCKSCIKFDGRYCRLSPEPEFLAGAASHWCAQGEWRGWSDRYQEMEPFFWGEWDDDISAVPQVAG